jgi:membrane associated rhomboid family serine protease
MLLIPIIGKISWRNPPFITLGLILINCIIFFSFQLGENRAYHAFQKHYFKSGLLEIEVPRYLAYAAAKPYSQAYSHEFSRMNKDAIGPVTAKLHKDALFQKKLDNNEIINPADPIYEKWKGLRAEHLSLYESIVSVKYGFRPAHARPVTWVSYMFLHGSVSHLVGNMIFLWLVGCILEYGMGRRYYPVLYILGGLIAVLLYFAVKQTSIVPLVGASGAIAGLMGAFGVIFGRERVRIFLSLGFYFNYFKVRAIYLLPLWVGNELYQLFYGGASQVAYTAHLGGLVGGAGLAFIYKRYIGAVDTRILQDDGEDKVSPKLEAAMSHMGKLAFGKARKLLLELRSEEPDRTDVMRLLFNIDRHFPERRAVHQTTAVYLKRLSGDISQWNTVLSVYDRYLFAVKKPRLPLDLFLNVSRAMTAENRPADAERILAMLLKNKPDMPGLPAAFKRLVEVWDQAGKPERRDRCRKVIIARFPKSAEAAEIR